MDALKNMRKYTQEATIKFEIKQSIANIKRIDIVIFVI